MRYVVLHSKRVDSSFPAGGYDSSEKTLRERVEAALLLGATLVGGVSCDAAGNYLQAVLFSEDKSPSVAA